MIATPANAIAGHSRRRYDAAVIYVKSVVAGLAGLVLGAILFPLVYGSIAILLTKNASGPDNTAVTWDLRSSVSSAFLWAYALTAILFFAVAFLWEYRRASH